MTPTKSVKATLCRVLAGVTIISLISISVGSQSLATNVKPNPSLGVSEVITIEALAERIKSTKQSIEVQKLELEELAKASNAKLSKLKDELSALYKERDDLLRDLKGGFFCSQCGKAKSEFEKEGKSFEQHLGEVRGVAIPASTSRIEAVREDYKLKIAYKKVQIQNFEKGDSAVARKRLAIADLENQLSSLCDKITQHSKSYERILEKETRDMQFGWARDLMNYASDIFIAEDRIIIHEANIVALTKAFAHQSIEERDRVENQNLEDRENRRNRIAENDREITAQNLKVKELTDPLETRRSELNDRINEINTELRETDLGVADRQALLQEKAMLTAEVIRIERETGSHNLNHSKVVASLERAKDLLQSEIFRLNTDLPKQQEKAVERLRVVFEKQKAEIRAQITNVSKQLADARIAYKDREAFYSKVNDAFYNVVAGESDRMVIVGKNVSCPVANQARQFVAQNWNTVLPCISTATTRAKPYSTNVFGSYCPKEITASSFGKYKTFLSGLSIDNLAAVKANSNVGWYESLFENTH